MFPNLKLIGLGLGALALLAALGTAGAFIEKRGYDKASAALQPKIDAANQALGAAAAANQADEATIAALTANDAANAALTDELEAKLAAARQQSQDVATTIRKLQNDDQTVAAFLGLAIPPALRGVLNHGNPRAADPGANPNGRAAAAKAAAVPGRANP